MCASTSSSVHMADEWAYSVTTAQKNNLHAPHIQFAITLYSCCIFSSLFSSDLQSLESTRRMMALCEEVNYSYSHTYIHTHTILFCTKQIQFPFPFLSLYLCLPLFLCSSRKVQNNTTFRMS